MSAGQIASALQTAFGDSEAAVYNAFQQIGQGGQSVLDAINGFFNTGSYWIYSNPWYSVPLFLDDSNGSYAAGNGIIQWTWNGGHNQDWYVLPTDSGYAEIVNRQHRPVPVAVRRRRRPGRAVPLLRLDRAAVVPGRLPGPEPELHRAQRHQPLVTG